MCTLKALKKNGLIMLIKTITYNDFSLLKDNFLLRFIKKYIAISSTYRNIGAFFIDARIMHV
jgi:hypothetical protein